MRRYLYLTALLLCCAFAWISCSKDDFPVDEDGLLITTRAECYVSDFQLLGSDFQTVLTAKKTGDRYNCLHHTCRSAVRH